MFSADTPSASRPRQLIGLVLTVLVLAGAGVVAWTSERSESAPGAGYVCVTDSSMTAEEEAAALGLCHRENLDEYRRTTLPARTMMDPAASRVWRAVFEAVCSPDGSYACYPTSPRPATSADVEYVRGVLLAEGFPDAIVRLARPDDPAPAGAVMYAVTIPGQGCIVAYAEIGKGARPSDVSGTLPDGRCLAR